MDIVLRAAVAYVFIVFMLRIVGRRELSSLGPTDLVLLVVMGDLIQNHSDPMALDAATREAMVCAHLDPNARSAAGSLRSID